MSVNRWAIFDTFIERHRDNFQHLVDHLTSHYNQLHLHFPFVSDKINQWHLFICFLLTFILFIIIFLIISNYHHLLNYIRHYSQLIYSYNQSIWFRIRYQFQDKSTSSFLNVLLNCKIRSKSNFCNPIDIGHLLMNYQYKLLSFCHLSQYIVVIGQKSILIHFK